MQRSNSDSEKPEDKGKQDAASDTGTRNGGDGEAREDQSDGAREDIYRTGVKEGQVRDTAEKFEKEIAAKQTAGVRAGELQRGAIRRPSRSSDTELDTQQATEQGLSSEQKAACHQAMASLEKVERDLTSEAIEVSFETLSNATSEPKARENASGAILSYMDDMKAGIDTAIQALLNASLWEDEDLTPGKAELTAEKKMPVPLRQAANVCSDEVTRCATTVKSLLTTTGPDEKISEDAINAAKSTIGMTNTAIGQLKMELTAVAGEKTEAAVVAPQDTSSPKGTTGDTTLQNPPTSTADSGVSGASASTGTPVDPALAKTTPPLTPAPGDGKTAAPGSNPVKSDSKSSAPQPPTPLTEEQMQTLERTASNQHNLLALMASNMYANIAVAHQDKTLSNKRVEENIKYAKKYLADAEQYMKQRGAAVNPSVITNKKFAQRIIALQQELADKIAYFGDDAKLVENKPDLIEAAIGGMTTASSSSGDSYALTSTCKPLGNYQVTDQLQSTHARVIVSRATPQAEPMTFVQTAKGNFYKTRIVKPSNSILKEDHYATASNMIDNHRAFLPNQHADLTLEPPAKPGANPAAATAFVEALIVMAAAKGIKSSAIIIPASCGIDDARKADLMTEGRDLAARMLPEITDMVSNYSAKKTLQSCGYDVNNQAVAFPDLHPEHLKVGGNPLDPFNLEMAERYCQSNYQRPVDLATQITGDVTRIPTPPVTPATPATPATPVTPATPTPAHRAAPPLPQPTPQPQSNPQQQSSSTSTTARALRQTATLTPAPRSESAASNTEGSTTPSTDSPGNNSNNDSTAGVENVNDGSSSNTTPSRRHSIS
ncbi:MAG TPA: hypothetical protein VNC84_00030 [Gammaproteobacteria bacterium]|jgi:hypothetical protein|nr:hypothetical protein [Gammaproteobacteria bacterium]